MIERACLLLALSLLTACANHSGRGIPAPVEERGSTGAVLAPAPQSTGGAITRPAEIIREDVRQMPPVDDAPIGRAPARVIPAPTEPAPPATPETPATASSTLLAGVDAAIAEGDLERAAALCERALRINPRDALLWYRLASVRARQGRVNEAEGFARRALSFSANDPALTRQINTFLEGL